MRSVAGFGVVGDRAGNEPGLDVGEGTVGEMPGRSGRTGHRARAGFVPSLDRRRPFGAHEAFGKACVAIGGAEVAGRAALVYEHPSLHGGSRIGERHVEAVRVDLRPRGCRVEQHRGAEQDRVVEPGDQLAEIEFVTLAVGDRNDAEQLPARSCRDRRRTRLARSSAGIPRSRCACGTVARRESACCTGMLRTA